tara:strand:- start:74273 stop:74539 length:267 start_codon:yes stop_codon:yes gene_type:complete
MKRNIFILLLILPFTILGIGSWVFEFSWSQEYRVVFLLVMMAYVSMLMAVRLKYLGSSWNEVLYAFIPFVGVKKRFSVFQKDTLQGPE